MKGRRCNLEPNVLFRLRLFRSIQELQLEKSHLELENKEMEKKLQQLQENMSREKQERE